MKISILSRFNASVLFEYEAKENSIKITMQAASKIGANLYNADLALCDAHNASESE